MTAGDAETTDSSLPRPRVDVSGYSSHFTLRSRIGRTLWSLVQATAFRWSPTPCFGWRRLLLRLFGARLARHAAVYPDARIWAPWNLEMEEFACLGPAVNCYCVDRILVGAHATVSQRAHLCGAGHDLADPAMRLVHAPIRIGPGAWVCAEAFVSPGLTLGEGAVLAARGCLTKDLPAWEVWGGNPARFIKVRTLEPRA
jgi:putative colanic acid biosynthesis acetyltransferase WcaF